MTGVCFRCGKPESSALGFKCEGRPTTSPDPDEWTYEGNFERLCQEAEEHEREDARIIAELESARERIRELERLLAEATCRSDGK
jgi:hypothetical protein